MISRDEASEKPIDSANAAVGLLSLLVNMEILSVVREHLGVLKEAQTLKAQELELQRVQAGNDLRFYETVTAKLDEISRRL